MKYVRKWERLIGFNGGYVVLVFFLYYKIFLGEWWKADTSFVKAISLVLPVFLVVLWGYVNYIIINNIFSNTELVLWEPRQDEDVDTELERYRKELEKYQIQKKFLQPQINRVFSLMDQTKASIEALYEILQRNQREKVPIIEQEVENTKELIADSVRQILNLITFLNKNNWKREDYQKYLLEMEYLSDSIKQRLSLFDELIHVTAELDRQENWAKNESLNATITALTQARNMSTFKRRK